MEDSCLIGGMRLVNLRNDRVSFSISCLLHMLVFLLFPWRGTLQDQWIVMAIMLRFLGATVSYSIESTRVWVDNTKVRDVLFGFYKGAFPVKSKALEMVLLDLPGLLFFSTYTLLVLFWAEIYHQARSLPTNKLRSTYYSINGIIYFAQACLWISVRLSQSRLSMELSKLFISLHHSVLHLGS